jgi:hypothetical protein
MKTSRVILAIGILSAFTQAVLAAPNITSMSVRGLQIGGTTKVIIQGSDLLPAPQLVTTFAIAKQTVIGKPAANRIEFDVTLGTDITPGVFNLRVANEKGISPAVVVTVDHLAQIPLAAKIASLPVALHGTVAGSNIVKTVFTGTKNQKVTIDVEAIRIGGKLRPVVHLYDSRRRQIAWSLPNSTLFGDARLTTILPADGDYTIELHDLQYAVQNPNYFRIRVGSFQYVDQVFPPAIQKGKAAKLQLIGNVPAEVNVVAGSLDKFGSLAPVPWSDPKTASGIRPKLLISNIPELVETASKEAPQQLPAIPVAVSGRLDAVGQIDRYVVPVTEGAKLRFEVFADRIGSPIDTLLELKNDKGGRLGLNDDFTGTPDSRIDYTVAKGIKVIYVELKDQVERASAQSIYRLAVTSLDETSKKPGFTLNIASDTQNVPLGATRLLHVTAQRENYTGPIKIQVDNLPAGLTVSAPDIAAGSNATLVTITGVSKVTGSVITQVRGTSVGINPPVTQIATFDKHPLAKTQPWMQHDIAFASAPANAQPFKIEWGKAEAETPLVLGSTLKFSVKFLRPSGAIGSVRLSVVVGEPVPIINNRPDANRAVRAEKAILDIPMDPKAKAAFDALTAANAALLPVRTKLDATRTAQAKLVAVVAAELKQTTPQQVAAVQALEAAITELNGSEKTKTDALSAVAQLKLKVAEAQDEAAKKTVIAQLDAATKALASVETSQTTLTAKLAASKTALDAATKSVNAATSKLKTVQTAAAKANAVETAALKAAQAKQATAQKNFQTAEANIKKDAEFNVIVPPNFAGSSCDLAIKAELRSLDNRTVVAEVYSPVRRFIPLHPLKLKLTTPKFETKLVEKTGATLKLTGTLERLAGFNGDITVSIVGQPGGVAVPKVVVKPDKNDFTLELKFPANFKPTEVKTIKLFATGPFDKTKAKVLVRTEVPISINVLAANPAAKP